MEEIDIIVEDEKKIENNEMIKENNFKSFDKLCKIQNLLKRYSSIKELCN